MNFAAFYYVTQSGNVLFLSNVINKPQNYGFQGLTCRMMRCEQWNRELLLNGLILLHRKIVIIIGMVSYDTKYWIMTWISQLDKFVNKVHYKRIYYL